MGILKAVLVLLRAMLVAKVNLALRQQLAVSKQSVKRPKLLKLADGCLKRSNM